MTNRQRAELPSHRKLDRSTADGFVELCQHKAKHLNSQNLDQQRHAHDNSGDHVSRFIDVISCCCPLAACCCLSLWTITAAPTASCLTCPLPHTCLLFHSPPRVGHLATSLTSPKSPRSGILTSSHSINQPCCLYVCHRHRHRRRHHVWEVGEKQNPEN